MGYSVLRCKPGGDISSQATASARGFLHEMTKLSLRVEAANKEKDAPHKHTARTPSSSIRGYAGTCSSTPRSGASQKPPNTQHSPHVFSAYTGARTKRRLFPGYAFGTEMRSQSSCMLVFADSTRNPAY